MSNLAEAKFNMIEQQIRPWEVLDPEVLEVFNSVQRDHFVPAKYKGLSYADCALPVSGTATMLPPTVEGRMLQALGIQPKDSVLQIGSSCGYITACMASLSQNVTCIDLHAADSEATKNNLESFDNATLSQKISLQTIESLTDIKTEKRFDVIAISAGSIDAVPQNLIDALAIGGRLFAVTGQSPVKHAQLISRVSETEWQTETVFETDIAAIV